MSTCCAGMYQGKGHDADCPERNEEAERQVRDHLAGKCGGYYECGLCAAEASAEKARVEGRHGGRLRGPTQTDADARRAQAKRRAKAKAARRARKEARRGM